MSELTGNSTWTLDRRLERAVFGAELGRRDATFLRCREF